MAKNNPIIADAARSTGSNADLPTNDLAAIELLVFDWDGTLADSEARIVRSMMYAVSSLGLQPPERMRMRAVIGLGLVEAMAALFADAPPHERPDPQLLAARYKEHFLSSATEPVCLFEGARETLHGLLDAGYRLAVATGKGRRGLDRDLRQCALADCFEATRCADEAYSKPHPQMLHDLLEYTVVDAERALMIGDTDFDILMAKNAGVAALGVTCGVHDAGRLQAASPLALLPNVSCLPDWLAALSTPVV